MTDITLDEYGQRKPAMFRLIRYFSFSSAIAILVAIVLLVSFYRQNAVDGLIETVEGQNVALARSISNILWPRFSDYIASVSGEDGDTIRRHPQTKEIQDALTMITFGLPVLKVKIYDINGLTVYSSEPRQIGGDKSYNQGFLTAVREGKPASKLSERDTFSAFSEVVQNRDLVETYIPIRGDDGTIGGAFELYTDVTSLKMTIDHVTFKILVGLFLVFGLLYGVLTLIVRRADQILKTQYADLMEREKVIKTQNIRLEHENTERRAAESSLQEAHFTLELRVQERTSALECEIAERKRVEEEMRAAKERAEVANRSKSEFLANMSHELRTPLNAIIGFSDIMKDSLFGPVGNPKYVDYVKDINGSGMQLLELINDILDLSKIEAGQTELDEEAIDVKHVLDSCLTLVKDRAREAGVEVECDTAANLPKLYADPRMLKKILINLLSNAIKFTLAGGKVVIKTWSNADTGYVFEIADTGIGIAVGDVPKVLTSFEQADGGLDRKFDGAGLGLPLTKSLAELHGGTLDLQSEVGVGTTMMVRFPAMRVVNGNPSSRFASML